MQDTQLKVLIVDDHSLVSEGIALILKKLHPDSTAVCVGSFATACDVLRQSNDVTLILLDVALNDVTDLSGLRRLRADYAAIPVVVISAHDSPEIVLEALDNGAMGFIPKSAPTSVLAHALQLVFDGQVYVPPAVLAQRTEGMPLQRMRSASEALELTDRETEVLAYLMQGMSNKHIARELEISDHTVRKHVSTVLRSLRVRTRTEAVLEVARRGLKLDLSK